MPAIKHRTMENKPAARNLYEYVDVDPNKWIPSAVYPLIKFKYPKFNPVQSAFLAVHMDDTNCVVESETSSGKTVVACLAIAEAVFGRKKKAIYLAPLKALTQEKIDEWTDPSHDFSKKKMVIATGDYAVGDKREGVLAQAQDADIVIMTTELFDSLTRRPEKVMTLFRECGVIVVDESHLLAVTNRGSALESALLRFTAISGAKIVFLSATMPNSEEIAGWLTTLNSKLTYLIKSTWRPCEIGDHFVPYEDRGGWDHKKTQLTSTILEILDHYTEDKFIVFVHSKKFGRELCQLLKHRGLNVEFHNADIGKDDRLRFVEMFKQRRRENKDSIDVLVATSTLAWGVNAPARRVIIADVTRGPEDIPVWDIWQMRGRSGRYGIDPRGDVYYVIPRSKLNYHKDRIMKKQPVRSCFLREDELAFHIVNEINEGFNTDEMIVGWFKRSLASFAWDNPDLTIEEHITSVLKRLNSCRAIKLVDGGEQWVWEVTPIGKIASWFYYSPFMVASVSYNLAKAGGVAERDDYILAWALGRSHQGQQYSCRDADGFAGILSKRLTRHYAERNIENGALGVPQKNTTSMAYAFYLVLNESPTASPEMISIVRGIQADGERLGAMVQSLKQFYPNDLAGINAKNLSLRLKYGVKKEIAELCSIPNIGATRAKKLYGAGYKTVAIIQSNIEQASKVAGVPIVFGDKLSKARAGLFSGAECTKTGKKCAEVIS